MSVRVTTFAGARPDPLAAEIDDEGAPPPSDARVTILDASGDIVSSSSPQTVGELEAKRAEAAAKISSAPPPPAEPAKRGPYAKRSTSLIEIPDDPRALRKYCLDVAMKSGLTDIPDLLNAARALMEFLEG